MNLSNHHLDQDTFTSSKYVSNVSNTANAYVLFWEINTITYEITFLRQFHFIFYYLIFLHKVLVSPNRNLETNRTKSVKERLKKSTWTPIVLSWTNRFLPSFFRWNRWNPQMNLLNHFLVKLKASNLLEMVWVTLQKKPLVHSTIHFVQKRKMMFQDMSSDWSTQ